MKIWPKKKKKKKKKNKKNVSGNMPEKNGSIGKDIFFFFSYHVKYLNIDIQFNQN